MLLIPISRTYNYMYIVTQEACCSSSIPHLTDSGGVLIAHLEVFLNFEVGSPKILLHLSSRNIIKINDNDDV